MGFALVNSFYFWNLQTSPVPLMYIGADNYSMVFQTTPFVEAFKNTMLLSFLGTFAQFWLGMGIALLLNSHLRGMSVTRAVLIMPTTGRAHCRRVFVPLHVRARGGIVQCCCGD
jgi:ABC-type sugar transport system permease subunit